MYSNYYCNGDQQRWSCISKICGSIEIFLSLHLQIFQDDILSLVLQVFIGGSQGKWNHNFYFDSGHQGKLLICCSMSAVPKPTSQKRLVVGCCIYGTFGELIPKPDPNKRECVHKHLIGNVLHAVSHGKYMVAFGNGETIECCSNCLRIERTTSSIPPDAPPQQAIKRPTNAPP